MQMYMYTFIQNMHAQEHVQCHAYVCVHVHMLIEHPEILHVVLLQIYFINSLIYTVIHFTMISMINFTLSVDHLHSLNGRTRRT